MSAAPQPPTSAPPVIPAPPPREGLRGKRRRSSDIRWLVWVVALAAGIGLGVAGYRTTSSVAQVFDYWLARML